MNKRGKFYVINSFPKIVREKVKKLKIIPYGKRKSVMPKPIISKVVQNKVTKKPLNPIIATHPKQIPKIQHSTINQKRPHIGLWVGITIFVIFLIGGGTFFFLQSEGSVAGQATGIGEIQLTEDIWINDRAGYQGDEWILEEGCTLTGGEEPWSINVDNNELIGVPHYIQGQGSQGVTWDWESNQHLYQSYWLNERSDGTYILEKGPTQTNSPSTKWGILEMGVSAIKIPYRKINEGKKGVHWDYCGKEEEDPTSNQKFNCEDPDKTYPFGIIFDKQTVSLKLNKESLKTKSTTTFEDESFSDTCSDKSILVEGFCYQEKVVWNGFPCPEGLICEDGACK
jgi:hypothetical protein